MNGHISSSNVPVVIEDPHQRLLNKMQDCLDSLAELHKEINKQNKLILNIKRNQRNLDEALDSMYRGSV